MTKQILKKPPSFHKLSDISNKKIINFGDLFRELATAYFPI
jgi:hypothetical protein